VLEHSGVLRREVVGRVHRCRLDPRPMRDAAAWIEKQDRFWNASLDRLDQYFATTPQRKKKR